MKINFTGQLDALPNKNPQNGVTYSGYVRLADLVSAHKIYGRDLYEVNVRGQLASTYSQIIKNKTCKGILKTLEEIHEGKLDPISFYNANQGCLIICESINMSGDTYNIEIKHPYQGIGNGQQTINTSSFFSNKTDINPNIFVQVKVMVGYNHNDSHVACVRNNTSSRITEKNVISNDWTTLAKQLEAVGITLVYKTDAVKPKKSKGRIINLHEKNYYNTLNSYFNGTPWITGNEVIEGFNVQSVTVNELLKIDNFKIELVEWFNKNIENYDTTLFDYKRVGYIQNLIVTAFAKYYDNSLSLSEFVKLCFDKSIYPAMVREGKRVEHGYFLNRTNIENLLDNIESKITIYKMKQKELQTV